MPNYKKEWEEAERYPDLFPTYKDWIKSFKSGHVEIIDCSMILTNTDMCTGKLDDLDPEKVKRAIYSIKQGIVELPIFLKKGAQYECLGGNTRLTALRTYGFLIKAWVVDTGVPFKEDIKNGYNYRTFKSDVNEEELKWHWDEEDRIVECEHETDWLFQMDDKLPVKIVKNTPIFIPEGQYHRIIKGTGDITVKVRKMGKK
jgi:hypothetical protein